MVSAKCIRNWYIRCTISRIYWSFFSVRESMDEGVSAIDKFRALFYATLSSGLYSLLLNWFCLLQLRPNFADAWSNLASAYMRKGRLNDAAHCCRQALALNPHLVDHFLKYLFDYKVVLSYCSLTVQLLQVDAHSNLGNLMKAQGLVQEVRTFQIVGLVDASSPEKSC